MIYYTADHNYRNDADRIDAFYEYMGLYNGTVINFWLLSSDNNNTSV